MANLVDKLKSSRGDMVYLVRGKDKGRPAWHYVLLDKLKKPMFEKTIKTGAIDVAEYGTILYSGWGENPPQDIVDRIKSEFD